VMQSSGGTMAAEQAGRHAVHMLLSGPAGGLAAARFVGQLAGRDRLLTFDMGGTSTDVALIEGNLQLTNEGHIGDYPVAVPMVDMHTIGAGGGSIASVDAGGLLQVGPQSAGADPGPACYGKGGVQATVTDANLVLGRLRADAFLGGGMHLHETAARNAVRAIAEQLGLDIAAAALGIVQLANEHMAQALRVMSVQRGIDPRELTLVSFGGAGGLHVCALAEALEMREALVPVHAGVLSALGMLVAPRSRQLSQTINQLLQQCDANLLESLYTPLIAQGRHELLAEGVTEDALQILRSVDVRYQGQSYYLNVPWQGSEQTARAFHDLHEQRYGHALDNPLEIVNVRVALFSETEKPQLESTQTSAPTPAQTISLHGVDTPVQLWRRDSLGVGETIQGPALITETISTTYLAQGWQGVKDQFGNILLSRF
jgi:N-methylhydantoinase A